MPKDASATRDALLHAGAHLFAAHGIDAARTRDIVTLAGQGNDSAVTYHFGSRAGLLDAVLRAGITRMEPARAAALPGLRPGDLPAITAAIVEPTADELRTEHGRDFLRITAQLAGRAGIRDRHLPPLLRGTALQGQLELLQDACRAVHVEAIALERVSHFIAFLTAALADRAARLPDPAPPALAHDVYTADLTAMLTAALRTPAPAPTRLPKHPPPNTVKTSPRGGAVR
ncbi:TetR/AcrR family transcriptional regulator [Actinomadura sp. NAK00032]|uniref:TetR/AcrR family transcriptional regulator n=1 Tax=Actinomadura sp. NAK00032 TaxID=2742128 RepID=UPI001591CE84|nr:helix-turn-helix domain-containing protein [Actinomadura sp. NAK00032]QKW34409.1 TetR/AcrR family transcriptional regulator [Actinomadura sp. NAK00032]